MGKHLVLSGVWLALVCLTWFSLLIYERTPGAHAAAAHTWPLRASLMRNAAGPSLVMFAHPACPCTRASLTELGEILLRSDCRRVQTYVVFFADESQGQKWLATDLVNFAKTMPGVKVIADVGGVETKLFGATTSGDLKVYDRSGTLCYSGGITAERGHEGDSNGKSVVLRLLNKQSLLAVGGHPGANPVFGCPILPEAR